MSTRIQLRRGTKAFWADENPILFSGEPGWEKDTRKMKVGDGETPWNELPYSPNVPASNVGGGGTGGGGGGTGVDEDFPDLVLFYNNGKV